MNAILHLARNRFAAMLLAFVALLSPINANAYCSSCWWAGYNYACSGCAAVFSTLEGMLSSLSSQLSSSTQQINRNIDMTRSSLQQSIESLQNAVISAIEKQSAAQKEMAQADINYDAATKMQEAGSEADDKFTSASSDIMNPDVAANACATMSSAAATTTAAQNAQLTARALTASTQRKHLYTSNAGAVMQQTLEAHNTNFCSAEDARRGRCGSGGNTSVPAAMQNANLNAGSLLAPSGGQTYNADEMRAALQYIDNVIGPIPQEQLPIALEKTPAGQRYVIEDRALNSVRSMAAYTLNQIFAGRNPEDTSSNATAGAKISIVGLMQKFVEDRYGNAQYRASLSTLGQEGLMRDIAENMAFQNWMQYYSYMQGERTEALLATTLALNARERSERVLPAMRQTATQNLAR